MYGVIRQQFGFINNFLSAIDTLPLVKSVKMFEEFYILNELNPDKIHIYEDLHNIDWFWERPRLFISYSWKKELVITRNV